MNTAVMEIDNVTQQNATNAERICFGIRRIKQSDAAELQNMVAQFKLSRKTVVNQTSNRRKPIR